MADTAGEQLAQALREQRLVSLELAKHITGDTWTAERLPGQRAAQALYSHLLAWDEWAAAVFELEPPLPVKLVAALRDVDSFNARAVGRFAAIPRDDLLTALEWANTRVIVAAHGLGGDEWSQRRIPDLAPTGAGPHSRGPRVGGMLKMLLEHEREHASEVSSAYNITVDLEELRRRALGQHDAPPDLDGGGDGGDDDDGGGDDGDDENGDEDGEDQD